MLVGLLLGCIDGIRFGWYDGVPEGIRLGCLDGLPIGSFDGKLEGCILGRRSG